MGLLALTKFFMKERNSVILKLTQIHKMLQFLASPKIFFVDQGLFYLYILIFKLSYLAVEKSLRGRS